MKCGTRPKRDQARKGNQIIESSLQGGSMVPKVSETVTERWPTVAAVITGLWLSLPPNNRRMGLKTSRQTTPKGESKQKMEDVRVEDQDQQKV